MKTIQPAELQNILASQTDAAVLDVRTSLEFDEVHVPQARNLPLDELDADSLSLAKDRPVYLLCRGGQRAIRAAEKLSRAGYREPVVIAGGTIAWIEAGLPVTRGEAKAISLERQVRIAAGSLVLIGVVLGWFISRWLFLFSGFVGAGLVFAGVTDYCGMGMLLARMPWNRRRANPNPPA